MGLTDTSYYTKWISNKDLLYVTGNYIQYLIITYNKNNVKNTFIFTAELLCCTPETNAICKSTIFQLREKKKLLFVLIFL